MSEISVALDIIKKNRFDKTRHIEATHLRNPTIATNQDIEFKKTTGATNPADSMTNESSNPWIDEYIPLMESIYIYIYIYIYTYQRRVTAIIQIIGEIRDHLRRGHGEIAHEGMTVDRPGGNNSRL